jgi:hypothetical protein
MGDWKPDQTTTLAVPDKQVGREKSSKVHFWTVPAPVEGTWCGAGPLGSYVLKLTQKYQEVTGTLQRRERSWPITGRLLGPTLTTQETEVGQLELRREGERLVLTGGRGAIAMVRGTSFNAATQGRCEGA